MFQIKRFHNLRGHHNLDAKIWHVINEKYIHTSQYNSVCQYVKLNPEIYTKDSTL